jgi:hypothetical protein
MAINTITSPRTRSRELMRFEVGSRNGILRD